MKRIYNLLKNVLIDVEESIREGINVDILAKKYSFSCRHLNRLFKFAYKLSLAKYIHSRRLVESLSDLIETDTKIIHIALDYGFDYEQSYIRAFKREFGMTHGEFSKMGYAVKVNLLLHLFNENKFPMAYL